MIASHFRDTTLTQDTTYTGAQLTLTLCAKQQTQAHAPYKHKGKPLTAKGDTLQRLQVWYVNTAALISTFSEISAGSAQWCDLHTNINGCSIRIAALSKCTDNPIRAKVCTSGQKGSFDMGASKEKNGNICLLCRKSEEIFFLFSVLNT